MPAQRTTTNRKDANLTKPSSKSGSDTGSWETDSTGDGPLGLDFEITGRPVWDLRREHEELQEMEKDERKAIADAFNAENEKYEEGDPKDFPGYPWVISKQARKTFQDMDVGLQKRDVERMGMCFYNDTFGYGIDEVIKIHFKSFAKEFKKAEPSVGKMWQHIEAFAWLYIHNESDVAGTWGHIDDGEGVGETVAIICRALLTMLNQIEKDKVWDEIPNLGLILSIYFDWLLQFGDAMSCAVDEDVEAYPAMIRAYVEKHNLELKGPHGIEAALEGVNISDLDEDQVKLVEKAATKDKWKFKTAWNQFERQRIAGRLIVGPSCYDVTKMSKKERIKASYDNKDPLEEMGPIPSSGIY